jgi:hypothetical protein
MNFMSSAWEMIAKNKSIAETTRVAVTIVVNCVCVCAKYTRFPPSVASREICHHFCMMSRRVINILYMEKNNGNLLPAHLKQLRGVNQE